MSETDRHVGPAGPENLSLTPEQLELLLNYPGGVPSVVVNLLKF